MSVQPGMPEHKGLADRIKTLEAKVARLSRARTMQSTSLDGGTFRVKNGGTIEILDGSGNVIHTFDINGMTVFEADGSTLMQLDGTGITLNDGSGTKLIDLTTTGLRAYEADGSTLLVLDGSKLRFNRADGTRQLEITPAGGLKIYDTDGTTEKVVLDSNGLEVIGGMVTPVWPFTASPASPATNVSLDTDETQVLSVTIDPPDWVEVLNLVSIGRFQISNTSGGAQNLIGRTTNDDGGASEETVSGTHGSNDGVVSTVSFAVPNVETIALSPAGRSVDVVTTAELNTGTNSNNSFTLSVIGFGTRST